MIAVSISRMNECIFKSIAHPSINNMVAFMRFIFICVSPPPFIESPGVMKNSIKCPWTCQVLRFQVFFFEWWKVFPITVFISKGGDIGVRTHTCTC